MITDLSVCITNFKRPKYLDRCLQSVVNTGIKNIVVATMEPDQEVRDVLARYPITTVAELDDDMGCHECWMQAAYRSPTKRMILLHDDDVLMPELGKVYEDHIRGTLDSGNVGFASWRAHLLHDDGKIQPTEWFHGKPGVQSSGVVRDFLLKLGRLSLSPIISIFNRDVLLGALKEGGAELYKHEACLHHPGMLLGTEIVAYLRHAARFPRWLYVDKVLSMYGCCDSSGTVKAQKTGDLKHLTDGYDKARRYFMSGGAETPVHEPRIIFTYDSVEPLDEDERRRFDYAMSTWKFHFNSGDMLEFPTRVGQWSRSSADMGDTRPAPFFKDIINHGMAAALPEDVVVYCNRDIFLTSHAPERILAGVGKHGVMVAWRRNLKPKPGKIYKHVTNAKKDGGVDLIAFTPKWWAEHGKDMPDMLIGREGYDWVLRILAEEKHGKDIYQDDIIGHEPHESFWKKNKKTNPGQQHNRALAKVFFARRHDRRALQSLS